MKPLSTEKRVPEAVMLELRRFIAGVILFNQRVAERVGMNPTDMQCIHLLQLMGPLTAGKLAECTRLTTGGVTVALDRMEKAGLVRRERNPEDRRSVLVHLEPKTLAGVEEHYAEVAAQTAKLIASFPERELKTVLEFFKRMNAMGEAPGSGRSAAQEGPKKEAEGKRFRQKILRELRELREQAHFVVDGKDSPAVEAFNEALAKERRRKLN